MGKIGLNELTCLLRELCGDMDISADTELYESGLLDSFAFIGLLSELDGRGIRIEPTEWGMERFSSAEAIMDIILQKE
ncbi:MAG: hypothetical protein J6A37_12725 [Oscillospiraceae bacterium]|nr:hypothetical protein [Oscillospiraceae bacterium]